jgi:hypothetical protein
MGGDHTFLRSSRFCETSSLPLLGINTYKGVQFGALHSNELEYGTRQKDAIKLVNALEDDSTH